MDVVKLLKTRLAHQQKEVDEANKKLGEPGYPKAYRDRMVANLSKHYGYKAPVNVPKPSDNPVKDDSKLRLAKARAKAIIIRQRQRARSKGVNGINYDMD